MNSQREDLPSWSSKVLDWLAKLLSCEAFDEDDVNISEDPDLSVGVLDYDEDDLPPAFSEYQHVIENSSAYHWLRSKLEHDLLHSIPGDPYISMIGDAVFDHDIYRRVSRNSPPAKCIVEYVVDWNLLDFIQSEKYSEAPEDVVVQALTTTGSPTEAEALTCGNYIQRTWPQSGNQFLRLLQELIVKDRGSRHHGTYFGWISPESFHADVLSDT